VLATPPSEGLREHSVGSTLETRYRTGVYIIVTQISARCDGWKGRQEILRDHVAHCVEHAISSGNKADQRRKIEELMNVVSRAER
jgi:hypothetical protein